MEPLRFAVGIEDTFVPQPGPGGRTLDEYELTGHYEQWRADLDRAADCGPQMIRYGIPWYRVNPEPDTWVWSWVDEVFEHMLDRGLTPIVDLMHYGCPLWLDGEFANPDYPARVADYARRVGERYGDRITWYTPMNEPLLNALFCGEEGRWPPGLTGDGGFVQLLGQLGRGIVLTQQALQAVVTDPTLVHVEATFRYAGKAEHHERIAFLRERTWIICDLLFGRVGEAHVLWNYLARHGFSEDDAEFFSANPAEPDILGINYYPHITTTEFLEGPQRRAAWAGTEGIEELIRAFHARYDVPIFWTETSVDGSVDRRLGWLEDSVGLVRRLRGEGVPVVGYTWWPLFSMVDWDYREQGGPVSDWLVHMGLYDLKPTNGRLERVATPLVDAFRAVAAAGGAV